LLVGFYPFPEFLNRIERISEVAFSGDSEHVNVLGLAITAQLQHYMLLASHLGKIVSDPVLFVRELDDDRIIS
jgi:hypothetical protein